MKRRFISTLLILCMALIMLPAEAQAAGATSVTVRGVTLNSGEYLANGGTSVISTQPSVGGYVYFDGTTATLTLKDAEIDGTSSSGIRPAGPGDLTIELQGNSTVTGANSDSSNLSTGIFMYSDNLTITGDGRLTVIGGNPSNAGSCGIYAKLVSITESAEVTARGGIGTGTEGGSCGIYAFDSVTITGNATVTASGSESSSTKLDGGSYGIYAYNSVIITENAEVTVAGGTALNWSYGLYSKEFTISGNANLTANGGASANSSGICVDGGDININDGTVTANGGVAANSYGLYAANGGSININGGITTAAGDTQAMSPAPIIDASCGILEGTPSGISVEIGQQTKSTTPAANVVTVAKTSATQASVDFALTTAPTGIYKVYADNSTDTEHSTVTAALNSSTLTLSDNGGDIAATAYYISVTESGKSESDRLALIVGAYVPASSATTGNVTVSGKYGTALASDVDVIITLADDTFKDTLTGTDTWITNLPAGLSQEATRTNDTHAKITISGTPTAVSDNVAMAVSIPADSLNTSVTDLAVTANADAKYAIGRADGPAAPNGLAGVAPTVASALNGKITGTTALMEYSTTTDFASPTNCAAPATTGLANGTYYVRVKATITHEAGTYATVSIPAYAVPNPPSTGGSYTPALVTKIDSGGSISASNLNRLISSDKPLTVEGEDGAKLIFHTDALKAIDEQATGSVKVEIKDVSAEQQGDYAGKGAFSLTVISGGETITEFGGSVTVSLPYGLREGESAENVTVWYLSKDGSPTEIPCVYAPVTGLATFTAGCFPLYVAGIPDAAPWANPFTDVSEDDWYYEYVRYVYENALMQGTAADEFSPEITTDRAMIITILWRLEGKPEATSLVPFNDVEKEKYYYDAVAWAAQNKIVEGYSATGFGPEDAITREQLSAAFYRYAAYKELDVSARSELSVFRDKPSDWAFETVQWAVAERLLQGKDDGILDPLGSAKRCECAAILKRFVEKYKLR
jgi:hypothetical protein